MRTRTSRAAVGFASWPATKWPWFGQLAERGYLIAAVHRGKNLMVTGEVARLLDPICRAEIERMRAADRGGARLLDHLAAAGPSSVHRPADRAGGEAGGAAVDAGAAGAVRRDRLAVAGGDPRARGTSIPASWCPGIRSAPRPARRVPIPPTRSRTWSPPVCAPPSSRPRTSYGAGSRGSGTGRTRLLTASSATAGPGG